MKNTSNFDICYGCGVCALICPRRIIDIQLNEDGFYKPYIERADECIECGLCLSICAYNDKKIFLPNHIVNRSYAGWNQNEVVRHLCSSGGIGFSIANHLMDKGYKVCGVKYSVENTRAEHFISMNKEDLLETIGSKYIQSYMIAGLEKINETDKYLVVGTPCQIDSFRRYIDKKKIENKFLLMDFFCHGVPSMNLWKRYLKEKEKEVGNITCISWRNKENGLLDPLFVRFMSINKLNEIVDWKDSYNMFLKGEKTFLNSSKSKGDLFYSFFLGNHCLNKSCYDSCKYKMLSSSADIRIGDLWGKHFAGNKEGVSALIAITKQGDQLLTEIKENKLQPLSVDVVTEGQMRKGAIRPISYPYVKKALKGNSSLNFIYFITKVMIKIDRLLIFLKLKSI